jgi:hypothetical protein
VLDKTPGQVVRYARVERVVAAPEDVEVPGFFQFQTVVTTGDLNKIPDVIARSFFYDVAISILSNRYEL